MISSLVHWDLHFNIKYASSKHPSQRILFIHNHMKQVHLSCYLILLCGVGLHLHVFYVHSPVSFHHPYGIPAPWVHHVVLCPMQNPCFSPRASACPPPSPVLLLVSPSVSSAPWLACMCAERHSLQRLSRLPHHHLSQSMGKTKILRSWYKLRPESVNMSTVSLIW